MNCPFAKTTFEDDDKFWCVVGQILLLNAEDRCRLTQLAADPPRTKVGKFRVSKSGPKASYYVSERLPNTTRGYGNLEDVRHALVVIASGGALIESARPADHGDGHKGTIEIPTVPANTADEAGAATPKEDEAGADETLKAGPHHGTASEVCAKETAESCILEPEAVSSAPTTTEKRLSQANRFAQPGAVSPSSTAAEVEATDKSSAGAGVEETRQKISAETECGSCKPITPPEQAASRATGDRMANAFANTDAGVATDAPQPLAVATSDPVAGDARAHADPATSKTADSGMSPKMANQFAEPKRGKPSRSEPISAAPANAFADTDAGVATDAPQPLAVARSEPVAGDARAHADPATSKTADSGMPPQLANQFAEPKRGKPSRSAPISDSPANAFADNGVDAGQIPGVMEPVIPVLANSFASTDTEPSAAGSLTVTALQPPHSELAGAMASAQVSDERCDMASPLTTHRDAGKVDATSAETSEPRNLPVVGATGESRGLLPERQSGQNVRGPRELANRFANSADANGHRIGCQTSGEMEPSKNPNPRSVLGDSCSLHPTVPLIPSGMANAFATASENLDVLNEMMLRQLRMIFFGGILLGAMISAGGDLYFETAKSILLRPITDQDLRERPGNVPIGILPRGGAASADDPVRSEETGR